MANKKITLISLILLVTIVSASVYIYSSKTDFDQGTYNNTYYNTTNNAVQLNLSFNNGTYTSQIFNTGSNVSLNNLSWTYQRIQCPVGMEYINKLNGFCIDKYEAVALNSDGTWHEQSDNQEWRNTGTNSTTTLLTAGGKAGSMPGKYPWVYISADQSRTACSNAEKHLCTDEEWLASANYQGNYYNLPTTLSNCTVSTNCVLGNNLGPLGGDACYGGAMVNCVSSEGVYDMTGNVWEWTNSTVEYTKPCEPVGTTGYCYWNGTIFTNSSTQPKYGNDGVYFIGGTTTNKAVLRGGPWYIGANAGPFYSHLNNGPTYSHLDIGFRCCRS